MQLWYADDLTLLGRQAANALCLQLLTKAGPFFGYYPNRANSGMSAMRRAKQCTYHFICRQQYIDGIIGFNATHQEWLALMIQQWNDDIKTLAAVASCFPQTA
ncbi:hypothetical protein ACHAXS_000438 [Conticribra weissflogii]